MGLRFLRFFGAGAGLAMGIRDTILDQPSRAKTVLPNPRVAIPADKLRNIWEDGEACAAEYGEGICLCGTGVNYGKSKIGELMNKFGGIHSRIWDDEMFVNTVRIGESLQAEAQRGVWGVSQGGNEAAVNLAGMSLEACYSLGKEMLQHSVIWRDCRGGKEPTVFIYSSVDDAEESQRSGWFLRRASDCYAVAPAAEASEAGADDNQEALRSSTSDSGPAADALVTCDVSSCDGSLSFPEAVAHQCLLRMFPMNRLAQKPDGSHSGPCFVDWHASKYQFAEILTKLRDVNPQGIHERSDYLKPAFPTVPGNPPSPSFKAWRNEQWNRFGCGKDGHAAAYANSTVQPCGEGAC